MLDELFNLIKQNGQQAVVENSEVPNEHNDAVMQEAQSSIVDGLSNIKEPDQVNSLFESVQNGQTESNPAVQQISNNFTGNIMQKFGINGSTAASIASAIIPVVLAKMANRGGQGGAGGLDLGGLLGSLTGGRFGGGNLGGSNTSSGGGLGGNLGNMGAKLGLDKDGDGDVDLNDLTKMFK
ncbi:hypothetical protein [Dyadobacter fanqingshengii]|uniref:EF-hand domain-containing protein n=1 Tax=Dyadobacter fanqingshengii TaxID=2906443 RepID=A0A9X1PB78_9BACT|nr:hypothetical protein [Dyadobacter fanqingshengii]MCF0040463.1 hypothetical protein [Dyadobacter fanqingshengii]MCF2501935.1 hypothetical protein [Dyadobacter fanqingshengii]USJ37795.1 hypothetical protein NFI81_08415 [Dyadobacter fanqingshengii]